MMYESTWRNKWLTADASTIEDMINALQGATDLLRAMKARGVTLDPDSCIGDDYAVLVTDDPAVAVKFDFEEPQEDDDADCNYERKENMEYGSVWCSKGLTANARTIEDMIDALEGTADELRAMKARGVTLYPGSVRDGHALLVTDDPAVAAEFDFEEIEDEEYDDCLDAGNDVKE